MIRWVLVLSAFGLVACGGEKKTEAPTEAKEKVVTKAQDGEKCAKDSEGASGSCSSDFKCRKLAGAGEKCAVPDDCGQGLTCSDKHKTCFDPTGPEGGAIL